MRSSFDGTFYTVSIKQRVRSGSSELWTLRCNLHVVYRAALPLYLSPHRDGYWRYGQHCHKVALGVTKAWRGGKEVSRARPRPKLRGKRDETPMRHYVRYARRQLERND